MQLNFFIEQFVNTHKITPTYVHPIFDKLIADLNDPSYIPNRWVAILHDETNILCAATGRYSLFGTEPTCEIGLFGNFSAIHGLGSKLFDFIIESTKREIFRIDVLDNLTAYHCYINTAKRNLYHCCKMSPDLMSVVPLDDSYKFSRLIISKLNLNALNKLFRP
jgi:hypothetical protein